jgi:hypothetical protein
MMRLVTLGMVCATLACGGGNGAESVVPTDDESVTATFVPSGGNQQANSMAMTLGGASGDEVTVAFNLTDTPGVYGAAFRVTFDPARVEFEGFAPGSVLEAGGHHPTYQVQAAGAGAVDVGVSRNGNVPAVDVNGTKTLIRLMFRVTEAGTTPLAFSAPTLYDGGLPPQPIANVTWSAGSLLAE